MGQNTGLGGDAIVLDDGIHHGEQFAGLSDAVCRRVDADNGIAVTIKQTIENAGGDARLVIGWVVGLQPGRQSSL